MVLSINSRISKLLVVMLLIVCMMGSSILDAYAGPFLLLLEAPTLLAIAKGLIAAGLVFGAAYGASNINTIVNDYWAQQSEAIKQQWISYGIGAITIGVDVWNSLRSYVQSKVTAETQTDISVSNSTINLQFKNEVNGPSYAITTLPIYDKIDSPIYCTNVIIGADSVGSVYAIYNDKSSDTSYYSVGTNAFSVATNATIYSYSAYNKTWSKWGDFYGTNKKSVVFYNTYGNAYFIALNNVTKSAIDNIWNEWKSESCPWLYNSTSGSISVYAGALSPTYDWSNTYTGTKSVYVPTDVTADNVQTYATTLTDTTAADIAAEEIPTTETPTGAGEYTGILDLIYNAIQSIVTAAQSIADKVLDLPTTLTSIKDKTGELLGALTGAISTTLTNIYTGISSLVAGQAVQEYDIKTYKLPDLLRLLVLILLAILALFLAFLSLVVALRGVPADSSLIPEQTRLLLEWMKNITIPGFNLSFMTILIGFGTIMFLIGFVKAIKAFLVKDGKNVERMKAKKR